MGSPELASWAAREAASVRLPRQATPQRSLLRARQRVGLSCSGPSSLPDFTIKTAPELARESRGCAILRVSRAIAMFDAVKRTDSAARADHPVLAALSSVTSLP